MVDFFKDPVCGMKSFCRSVSCARPKRVRTSKIAPDKGCQTVRAMQSATPQPDPSKGATGRLAGCRRFGAVSFAAADHQLIKDAAADKETRRYIGGPWLEESTSAQCKICIAALRAFGCRYNESGIYERSDDPEHNRFYRKVRKVDAVYPVAEVLAAVTPIATCKRRVRDPKEELMERTAAVGELARREAAVVERARQL